MKRDLTLYGEDELNMWVQNDEGLYNEFNRQVDRATYLPPDSCFEELLEFLRECFVFTDAQEETLRESFDEELEIVNDENQD